MTSDADSAHHKACALIDERRFRDAIEPAAQVCQLRPDWADAWSNYAVALKHGQRWADCLAACDRVLALDAEANQGAHWNAGIASTALGNWSRARAAWRAFGIAVPEGEGPLEMEIGIAGVRVSPDDEPEVVFGKRLDPCRVRILSVPLPDSGRHFGDIVLHDGEPRGRRQIGEGTCSVFDELLLLDASRFGTWIAEVTCKTTDARDALLARFDDIEGVVEDWTESLEVLCEQCSLGEPHEHHAPKGPWKVERRFAIASVDGHEVARFEPHEIRSSSRVL